MKGLGVFKANSDSFLRDKFPIVVRRLEECLDKVLERFPAGLAVAEIMMYAPQPEYMVTVAIRPDSAPLLPTRLHLNEGVIGRAIQVHGLIAGRADGNLGQPRLLN